MTKAVEKMTRQEWEAHKASMLEGSLLERKRRALAAFIADQTAEWADIDTGFAAQFAHDAKEESAIVAYIKRFC